MSIPITLLSTKLYIPPVRPTLVSRPRLIVRLNAGLSVPLTLISAPAGFGKTTLVSEWVHTLEAMRDPPLRVAWLSLDEGDNDPARFFNYLFAALQQIHPAISQCAQIVSQSAQSPPPEALLTGLINVIASLSFPCILVLDDYHLISAVPVHQQVTLLLEHPPPRMHLVVITREDPPWPLSRLRACGQVEEIRQADLQFTIEETAGFLRRIAQAELSPDDLTAIQQRTEGWVVGLQLLALSLQGHGDVGQIVESFTGSQRYVLDYLIDEVFQRQPESVQEFLLKTSILDRFTAQLCESLMADFERPASILEMNHGDEASIQNRKSKIENRNTPARAMLDYLDRANVFIMPLDQSREWYRYHHLFADLLRHRLQIDHRYDVRQLHGQASRWYAENGFRADAIRHALAASDWERAAGFITSVRADLLKQGRIVTLLSWCQAIPAAFLRSHPRFCYEYVWPLLLTEQIDAAEYYLGLAEQATEGDTAFLGEIATARAYAAQARGDGRRAVELSQKALALLPQEDWASRSVVTVIVGMACWYAGRLDEASQVFTEAREASRQSGNAYSQATAQVFLCRIEAARGRLRQAATAYQRVIEEGGEIPIVALARTDLARLFYEWNDLDAAAVWALRALDLSRRSRGVELQLAGYRMLALIRQTQGDTSGAQVALQECDRLIQQPGVSPSGRWHALAYRALSMLASGEWGGASQSIEQFPALETIDTLPDYLILSLVRTRWLLAQQQWAAAATLLGVRYEKAARAGFQADVVGTRALQALSAPTPGTASAFLAEALALAEPEGYVRTFVDLGEPMAALLREVASQGIARAYAGRLMAAFRSTKRLDEGHAAQVQPLVDPLSDREREVLCRLVDGQSNQEIARALHITDNTVKAHLKHIYGKLDVSSRRQAVIKARQLDLLP
ncbi:MAG: LuxR C-terminal-related transcriptional regulator [Chloroflexi bacterium]|nr:LuxR C-terminal-related transcriptional regulator [Chloroflexota bacterium]